MATCAYCDTTILFGGKTDGQYRFCNDVCHQKGQVLMLADQIPVDIVKQQAREVHSGLCPACGKRRGPVDVHTAHRIWSAILMTSWVSQPQISCRGCGRKRQAIGMFSSLLLGWWGLPWGLIMTPVQVGKNLFALLRPNESSSPSPQLEQLVRMNLATEAVAEHQRAAS